MKGQNNMLAFTNRMIRDKFKMFVVYVISSIAFVEMYIALFPTIREQAAQFDQLLKSFPPELFKAMNMDASSMSFSTLESYLSTEYLSFLWPILAIVFAISLANHISVGEIDKGTIETLMSLPVKRIRIFAERYFAGLLLILSFCAISILIIVPLAALHKTDYIFANFVTTFIGSFFFAWAVYSLAVLTSVIFSEKGKSTMVASGVIVLMYVINILASLNENLQNLQYISFFHYFSGSDMLAKNIFTDYSLLAFGGFALVVSVLASIYFKNRDLSV